MNKMKISSLMGVASATTANVTGGEDKKHLLRFIDEVLKIDLEGLEPAEAYIATIHQKKAQTDASFMVESLGIELDSLPELLGDSSISSKKAEILKEAKLDMLDDGIRYEVYLPHSATKVYNDEEAVTIDCLVNFYKNEDCHRHLNTWNASGFVKLSINLIKPKASEAAQA